MKKILLMIAGVVLVTPFFVSAQTVTTQLTDTLLTQASNSCVDLQYNLSYRSRDAKTNGEVSDLQDFLNINGYLSVEPTGYYGTATVDAVKRFQVAVFGAATGTSGYGGIGSKSRAKIREMTCGTQISPSCPMFSPPSPDWCKDGVITYNKPINGCHMPPSCSAHSEVVTSPLPAGCTSERGFSVTTGQSCSVVGNTGMPMITTFYASPNQVSSGQTTTLYWDTKNATSCSLPGRSLGARGNTVVGPLLDWDSSFTITCNGLGGGVSKSLTVAVTTGATTSPLPAGCASAVGFSSTTGQSCATVVTTTTPSIRVLSPNGGESYPLESDMKVNWSVGNMPAGGYIVAQLEGEGRQITLGTTYQQAGTDNYYISAKNNIVPGNYRITLSIAGIKDSEFTSSMRDSSDGYITINPAKQTSDPATGVPVTTVAIGPSLQLGYDSYNKETSLKANAWINIAAGNTDLVVQKPGMSPSRTSYVYFGMGVTDNVGISWHYGVSSGNPIVTPNAPLSQVLDYGNYWLIPSGKSAQFSVTQAFKPKQMFAGTYHAIPYVYNVVNNISSNILSSGNGNSVTIIGETSPYISSVVSSLEVSANGNGYLITGVRFNSTSNSVTINGITKILPSISANNMIGFVTSDFGITTSGSYPVQVSTAGGASNIVYVNVTVPTTTATPYISSVSTICGIVAPGVCIISGTRFSPTSNQVTINGVTKVLPVSITPTPNESQIYFSPSDFGITTSGSYPVQVSTAGGASNIVYVNVTVPTTTATPSGTISASPSSCTIASGARYCTIPLAWTTANATDAYIVSLVSPFFQSAIPANGTGVLNFNAIVSGGNAIELRSGLSVLASVTVRGVCATGSTLDATGNCSPTATTTASVQFSNQLASVIGAFSQVPAPGPVSTWVYTWTRNLEVNSPYADDVRALQTALTKEGVYTGEVTGGFYTQTYLGVKAFQTKYSIEPTGFVGPVTLVKLNELY